MKSTFLVCCSLLLFGGIGAIVPNLEATSLANQEKQVSPVRSIGNISQNINRGSFETELLKLTNQERQKAGLAPLKLSSQLTRAAQSHAVDMAKNNYFSHQGLNGSSMVDRTKSTGYQYSALGENIAAGKATPEGTIRQWMNSPGHRANILNRKYTEIGFGYEYAPNSQYRYYWVQVFGAPQR
ncbi:MAG: hypothetical protein DCF20_17515 [Pseudanabaena sp.]|nr:MAG: hypothetical protein DCF20_17515 [Pseudanabaena sp.]